MPRSEYLNVDRRILVINSPTVDRGGFRGSPTSLLYAMGPLVEEVKARPKKINISGFSHLNIFDPVHYTSHTDRKLAEKLEQIKPHIVAISTTSDSFHIAVKMASIIKTATYRDNPGSTIIILGGPHCDEVDYRPEGSPHNPLLVSDFFDFVVAGDGEYMLAALVRTILKGMQQLRAGEGETDAHAIREYVAKNARSFERVGGQAQLYCTVDGQIRSIASSMKPIILEKLPPLRYEYLRKEHLQDFDVLFKDALTGLNRNCVQVITHRGCNGYCSFCSEKVLSFDQRGPYYNATKTPEGVVKEIRHYIQKVGAQAVFFDDSTFMEDAAFVTNLCDEMISSGLSEMIKWGCLNRFDKVEDPKLIGHMKQAGLTYMYLGLELFDDEALRGMNKSRNRVGSAHSKMTEVIQNALDMLKDNGVRVGVSILFGLPDVSEDVERQTIEYVGRMVDDKKIWLVSLSLFNYHLASLVSQAQRQRIRLDYRNVDSIMDRQNRPPWNCFEEGGWFPAVDRSVDDKYLARLLWYVDRHVRVKDGLVRKAELEEFIEFAWRQGLLDAPRVFSLISPLQNIALSEFVVVGNHVRYEEEARKYLHYVYKAILKGFGKVGRNPQHWLVWGPSGSGKTSFIEELGEEAKTQGIAFTELVLSKTDMTETRFVSEIAGVQRAREPLLCFVDEIQAKPDATWPREAIAGCLDVIRQDKLPITFVLAGSKGADVTELKQLICSYHMGSDMASRVSQECSIPPMSLGDRVIIALMSARQAGRERGEEVRAVEKTALYYIALNPRLETARQIALFVASGLERMPSGECGLAYAHLFESGDLENQRFCDNEAHKGHLMKLRGNYVNMSD